MGSGTLARRVFTVRIVHQGGYILFLGSGRARSVKDLKAPAGRCVAHRKSASRFSYNLWKRDGVGVPNAANDQPIVTWHVAWLFVGYEFADIAEFAAFARHVHVVVKTPDLAIVKVLEIETFATTQDRRILHPKRTI